MDLRDLEDGLLNYEEKEFIEFIKKNFMEKNF